MSRGDRSSEDQRSVGETDSYESEDATLRGSAPRATWSASLVEHVERLSREREEPEWLSRMRLDSVERFLQVPDDEAIQVVESLDVSRLGSRRARTEPRVGGAAYQGALAESEAAYRMIRKELEAQGVLFMGLREAVRDEPHRVREHLGQVVSGRDGAFASLNEALWSGGSFLYVPRGVHVDTPLQAEIREDYRQTEPMERILIVADEGAEVGFIDGCSAPVLTSASVHIPVVEILARKKARVRYIALLNWAKTMDSFATKRALLGERARLEWMEGNLGARRTVKAPSVHLRGVGAHADMVTATFVGPGQTQRLGAEIVHLAPETSSRTELRAVVRDGGQGTYSGRIRVEPGARGATSSNSWSALVLDDRSRWEAHPTVQLDEADALVSSSGSVETIREDTLFYMTSRGLSRTEASHMVVRGAFEPFTKRIPMEYAVEVNRILELEMEGAIG